MVKVFRNGVVEDGGDSFQPSVNAGTCCPELTPDIDGVFVVVVAHVFSPLKRYYIYFPELLFLLWGCVLPRMRSAGPGMAGSPE